MKTYTHGCVFLMCGVLAVPPALLAAPSLTVPPPVALPAFSSVSLTPSAAGRYIGLVQDDSLSENAGKIDLTVSSSGAITGSLLYRDAKASLRGTMGGAGSLSLSVKTGGSAMATIILQLQAAGASLQLGGTLTVLGRSHTVALPQVLKTASAAAPAGAYTLLVAPPALPAAGIPMGYGYATLSLTATGACAFAGKLGDGTAWSMSTSLGSESRIPIYVPLYKTVPAGHWSGVIVFKDVPGVSQLQGDMQWIKRLHMAEKSYPGGFDLRPTLVGARWEKPAAGTLMPPFLPQPQILTNARVTLADGLLVSPLDLFFKIGTDNKPVAMTPGASLALTTVTGFFSGTDAAKRAFAGVMLAAQGFGAGTFTASNLAGLCTVEPQNGIQGSLAVPATFPLAEKEVAERALQVMRAQFQVTPGKISGLPVNEVTRAELLSGARAKKFFVPAQLGTGLTAFVLGHKARALDPAFKGLDDSELNTRADASLSRLESILANSKAVHPSGGFKALFQVHSSTTGLPLNNDFARIVSLLDNNELMRGLLVLAEYVLVTPSLNQSLASRVDAILNQMSITQWMTTADGMPDLHGGVLRNPLEGSVFNRIFLEGRHAPVLARALGRIDDATERLLLLRMLGESLPGTAGGAPCQYMPYSGSGLELFVAAPALRAEADTLVGSSMARIGAAWLQTGATLGLPAVGATGVADGYSTGPGFKGFSLSPAEQSDPDYHNREVVVFPAVGELVSAVPSAGTQANFLNALRLAHVRGIYDPVFGLPNALSLGSNKDINNAKPVWGTLETAQMLVSLLDQMIGQEFLSSLLNHHAGWAAAASVYVEECNRLHAQAVMGGEYRPRPAAIGSQSRYLPQAADTSSITFTVAEAGTYAVSVRYSNDGAGAGEAISVVLDGSTVTPVEGLPVVDTRPVDGAAGVGWSYFTETAEVVVAAPLSAGVHTCIIGRVNSDPWGIEIDQVTLTRQP